MNITAIEFKCPLCDGQMTVYPDAPNIYGKSVGVRVQCDNPCDPQCHENPYGHGANAKEAYATAKDKFRKVK